MPSSYLIFRLGSCGSQTRPTERKKISSIRLSAWLEGCMTAAWSWSSPKARQRGGKGRCQDDEMRCERSDTAALLHHCSRAWWGPPGRGTRARHWHSHDGRWMDGENSSYSSPPPLAPLTVCCSSTNGFSPDSMVCPDPTQRGQRNGSRLVVSTLNHHRRRPRLHHLITNNT